MHDTAVYFLFMALLVLVAAGLGCALVPPMLDAMPPAKVRRVAGLWLALFLLAPACRQHLNGWLDGREHSYVYELGHEWPVWTVYGSGLAFWLVKRRLRR